MSKTPIDKIICIDLGNSKCKIILPLLMNEEVTVAHLQDPILQSKTADYFSYSLGYLKALFKKQGIKIVQVEILFQFKGQYLQLEQELRRRLQGEYESILVSVGVIVNIPQGDINVYKHYIEADVREFSKNSLHSN